jgi:DNA-binding NarL/FixJ family response regulator
LTISHCAVVEEAADAGETNGVKADRPPPHAAPFPGPDKGLRILVVSDVRFLGEGLTQALGGDSAVTDFHHSGDLADALGRIPELRPDIVLLDAGFSGGPSAIDRILSVAPLAKVVVFAVAETAESIVSWVEAGISGYIPRTTALADVMKLLSAIMREEQTCSASVTAGLMRRLRRIAVTARGAGDSRALPALTMREMQVIELICAGFSNKEIARRLNIGVATTKSHVHNLLGKLNLQRRSQVVPWMREVGPRFGTESRRPTRMAGPEV